ncbi:Ferric reduction oxidase 2 [Citrus sinensis]|nr:Ferric reduction oxidase 2 [Citrus sinensis]
METIKSAIKLLVMVIFLGYILLWIIMPTNKFYLNWLPQIQSKTNSTYFGEQGAYMLIYSFPILFIAALSCLYLHLGNNCNDNNVKSEGENISHFATWRRPVLVKGPLGIVSWIELSFAIMFIALLVWSFSSYLHGMFAQISQQAPAHDGEQAWVAKLEMSGLTLGLVGNICLAFLFFPVTRGSSVLQLIGLTSEASIKYHIWLGHIAMTIFTAHGLCYIIFWAKTDQISQMLGWDKVAVSNVAGEIGLLAGLAMWITSIPRIRRKIFELFFYTHHLYILFVVFFVLHVGFSYSCIILPGFYLFLIDRYLRFLQSQQRIRLVSARILPCDTVELNFFKSPGLSYNPTSILFVNVPVISKLQWHPFTITSSSNVDPDKLSVVIKSEGSWSRKLFQKLSSPSPLDRLEVSIEGPYGPASTHFTGHDMLVMISGGSGITPFISIIRELLSLANNSTGKTPRILLISAFKKSQDLAMLDLILPVLGTTLDISPLEVQIEAYVTREKKSAENNRQLVQTLWFKPKAEDSPVSAILGPKSWLWLAAIISSSFIIFLVLIGFLTRYYIYPIDHNSNTIYATSWRGGLNMLLICVSIVITATAAFLWNKKQHTKEMTRIQNTEKPTPIASPASWFYNAERELESLPHQSFIQATRVHYGERPNLKKLLMEIEATNVGVLVSGPKKMRQEVGEICASGFANNLHFESIAFSW